MAYATVDDMVGRFGAKEMIRASTPDGAEAVAVVDAPICTALADASALIDSYLAKRYRTPLDIAPQVINEAACVLARYTLSTGGERQPSDQVKEARAEKVAWLKLIATGQVVLDLAEVAPGDESFAAYSTRTQIFQDQVPYGDAACGGFDNGGWP